MLSIIIPTLNEEELLPLLLQSIKKQQISDCQIIVADAGSKDATLQIAKDYDCTIVEGGLPARGRNNGARVASGQVLFFLDADTILSDDFFKKAWGEFETRKLDVASFCLKPWPKNGYEHVLLNLFYNGMIVALEGILPHAAMGMLVKRDLFEKLHGFDETIKLAEDHDFGRRAAKLGRFGIIKSTELLISTRRFKKESWTLTGIKFFFCQLHMIFIGPVRSNLFNYKFNHYRSKK